MSKLYSLKSLYSCAFVLTSSKNIPKKYTQTIYPFHVDVIYNPFYLLHHYFWNNHDIFINIDVDISRNVSRPLGSTNNYLMVGHSFLNPIFA